MTPERFGLIISVSILCAFTNPLYSNQLPLPTENSFTYSLEKFNMNSEEGINLKGNTLNTGCYPVFLFMSVMTKQWAMYNSRVFSVVSMCEQNTESKR